MKRILKVYRNRWIEGQNEGNFIVLRESGFVNPGILIGFILISLLSSCTSEVKKDPDCFVTWQDDLGREVKVKKGAHRFLPFAPSVTEILYLFCDSSEIVGRTQNCNYPKEVLSKPVVNNYPPDLEKIVLLKPDLLITKEGMLTLQQAESIERIGVPVYFQRYDSVGAIFSAIRVLSKITGHETKGVQVADSLQKLLKTQTNSYNRAPRKKVLILISKENFYCFGRNTYASDIIHMSGGANAVDSLFNNPYPALSLEYIVKLNPDVILGGEQVGLQKDFFNLHPELKRLKAFRENQCYTINEDYLSRPGPRTILAIQIIHEILNTNEH